MIPKSTPLTQKDFEKWFFKWNQKLDNLDLVDYHIIGYWYQLDFIELPKEAQVGIYLSYFDKCGLRIKVIPEHYTDGINWNWQIVWYLPQEQQTKKSLIDGTGWHGDNGEYPDRLTALRSAIEKASEIREKQLK